MEAVRVLAEHLVADDVGELDDAVAVVWRRRREGVEEEGDAQKARVSEEFSIFDFRFSIEGASSGRHFRGRLFC